MRGRSVLLADDLRHQRHLTTLGIIVKDDGGLLCILAILSFLSSTVTPFIRREQIPIIGRFLRHHCHCNRPGPAVIQ